MKPMNMLDKREGKYEGLKERVARKVGAQLERMAVDRRACWFASIYEPETPPELIQEIIKNK